MYKDLLFPPSHSDTYFGGFVPDFSQKVECSDGGCNPSCCDIDLTRRRFYPHYGASGIRRNTRLYRPSNGRSKKPIKVEGVSLSKILASDKEARKRVRGKKWKRAY